QGRAMLFAMFGDVAEPVLVPPWNRIADCLPPLITACGLRGLSRFKPRVAKEAAPGVIEANTHIDLMDWRNSRVGKPLFVIVDEIIRHLTARRTGAADRHEATGLLTHHLVMDAPAWLALDEVLDRLAKDPRVAWRGAPQIFETVQ
ncbi:MAG: polysaccharide deacetylase family protein, partial [Alphaproteobacteria bacterium]